MKEVERWLGKKGWIGLKAHSFWHSYSIALLDDIAALCEEMGLPILLHLGSRREQCDFRFLPERQPKLKIIYAHAAVPLYREIWNYLTNREINFVDLSNPVYVDERILSQIITQLGHEKCLYGTDGPYVNATQDRMLSRIFSLPVSHQEKEKILGGIFQ